MSNIGLTLVSADEQGDTGVGQSHLASFSPDGQKIIFQSSNTYLVPDDEDYRTWFVVKDINNNSIKLISGSTIDDDVGVAAFDPTYSPDGLSITYSASLLQSNLYQVYIKNISTSEVNLISSDQFGIASNAGGSTPHFSSDGKSIIFVGNSTNLTSDDTNSHLNIFMKSLEDGSVKIVSSNAEGEVSNREVTDGEYALAADAQKLAFMSDATNLIPNDTTSGTNVYLKDLATGAVERVFEQDFLPPSAGNFSGLSLSPDGQKIAVQAPVEFAGGDDPYATGLVVKDMASGETVLATVDPLGNRLERTNFDTAFSPDGNKLAFVGRMDDPSRTDAEIADSIFIKDLSDGSLTTVFGPISTKSEGELQFKHISFSPDGTKLVFTSSDPLLADDTNIYEDIYLATLDNATPQITSSSNLVISEGTETVATIAATDLDGDLLTYRIAGGVDAGLFTIDSASGVLAFARAPDFEKPKDVGADNVYELSIGVTDGTTAIGQALKVTVTDAVDPPSAVIQVVASGDPDGGGYNGGPDPILGLFVNGERVGYEPVSARHDRNEWQVLEYEVAIDPAEIKTIEVSFTNEYYVAGAIDRNLFVDEVRIDGKVFKAEQASLVDLLDGTTAPGQEALWRLSSLIFDVEGQTASPPPTTEGFTVTVHSASDPYGDQWNPGPNAKFELLIDDVLVGTAESAVDHATGQWQATEFHIAQDLAATQSLAIRFINDWGTGPYDPAKDRNLYIKDVLVDEHELLPEDGSFHPRAGGSELGQEKIWTNGSLSFDLAALMPQAV